MNCRRYLARMELPPRHLKPLYYGMTVLSLMLAALFGRISYGLLLTMLAGEVSAADPAGMQAIALNAFDFAISCTIGAAGGLVAFWHEAQREHWPNKPVLFALLGHVLTAMFASVIAYLACIYYQQPEVVGFIASGMAGFSGFVGLTYAQRVIMAWGDRRAGIAPPVQPPSTGS